MTLIRGCALCRHYVRGDRYCVKHGSYHHDPTDTCSEFSMEDYEPVTESSGSVATVTPDQEQPGQLDYAVLTKYLRCVRCGGWVTTTLWKKGWVVNCQQCGAGMDTYHDDPVYALIAFRSNK